MNPQESSPEQRPSTRSKKTLILIIFTIFFTSSVVGILVYIWQQSVYESSKTELENEIAELKDQIKDLTEEQEGDAEEQDTQQENNSDDSDIDEEELKWTTFTSTNIEYSISYPEDWEFEEDFNENTGTVNFSITNNDYSIEYTQSSSLTAVCVYADTDTEQLKTELEKDFPGYYDQAKIELDNYIEFGEYRRSTYDEGMIICKDNMETGFIYSYPENPDSNMLTLMDQTVKSFVWVGTIL